jgi:hypothetical protein
VLVMADKDIELDCGSALVNASNAMGARLSNMRFVPRDANARFEIRQEQNGFRVVAYDGVLNVTNGSVPTLAPGQTMFAAAGCAADPTPSGQKSGAPIPAAGTNVGAAVLLGVVIAGGLAALVYFTTRSKKCTSPDGSNPCQSVSLSGLLMLYTRNKTPSGSRAISLAC